MNIHLPSVRGYVRQVRRHGRRAAFTLVEMLVTMAVSIILVFALAQAYAVFGTILAEGRAAIELAGSMRSVAHQLQRDLDNVTVPVRPWTDEGGAQGYFEYIDGPATDKYPVLPSLVDASIDFSRFGDTDDILAFTTQDVITPFVGVVGGNRLQSSHAEVIWWCQESIDGFGFDIYRRVLLIRPDLGVLDTGTFLNRPIGYTNLRNAIQAFAAENDISFRVSWRLTSDYAGNDNVDLRTGDINNDQYHVQVQFIANSLADLTRRENRFLHRHPFPNWTNADEKPAPYPFPMDSDMLLELGRLRPQDRQLTEALAFDVQAFDPQARIYRSADGDALVPSDPGYVVAAWGAPLGTAAPSPAPIPLGFGAFVDLGYGNPLRYPADPEELRTTVNTLNMRTWSLFSRNPAPHSALNQFTYCTWSTHYERDDRRQRRRANNLYYYQDPDPAADVNPEDKHDFATTGFYYGVERETSPPYPHPLRGIQVRLRAWDPDSRQVRQATVVSNFIPE